jgi:hypothetical protein
VEFPTDIRGIIDDMCGVFQKVYELIGKHIGVDIVINQSSRILEIFFNKRDVLFLQVLQPIGYLEFNTFEWFYRHTESLEFHFWVGEV